jgi:predicted nuclease of restriction endonuclease-like (RecB) superfamily
MRAFAEAWPHEQFVQEVLAQITWYHNLTLLEKLNEEKDRIWYAKKTIEHGWSRNVLLHQIESGLHKRAGAATTNFQHTLPPPQSDLAQQMTRDPYTFDFLMLAEDARERELERGLLEHLRSFLLELGVGFAFVGSQFHLEVGSKDFYIDLLFYHLKLRCFVVIDLKARAFEPEFAGKMNFYLAAVDDLLRHPDDQPSIGLIICKTKDQVIAEYALRNSKTPIGISEYRLAEALPSNLKGSLPSIEELEHELKAGTETEQATEDEEK